MKYTIINSENGGLFIQQNYATLEEAQERLEALRQKVSGYSLVIVSVDDAGNFHTLKEKEEKEEETHEPDKTNRPVHAPTAKRRRD